MTPPDPAWDAGAAANESMTKLYTLARNFKHGAIFQRQFEDESRAILQSTYAAGQAAERAACIKIAEAHIESQSPALDTGNMWRIMMATKIASALREPR